MIEAIRDTVVNAARFQPEGDLTEDGLALELVKQFPNVRWVEAWSRWYVWNGQRWQHEPTLQMYDRARTICRALSSQCNEHDEKRLRRATTISAVERLAKSDRAYAATTDQWDRDPWLLNTPDGIIWLKTSDLTEHESCQYMTQITGTGIGNECPRWLKFLDEITDGDKELAMFLQRIAGYALTGSTREHAMFFFFGEGANGKGTLLNTLRGVLGDYAKVAPIEAFTENKGHRHETELAMLRGARLVISQETEGGRNWAEAKLKALTGGDPISARFMRQDFFEYSPTFKLIVAGNHKPSLRHVDEAIRRRLYMVPFTVTIPTERRDPDLVEKLEGEWPGILRWALNGCTAYLDRGLDPPERVRAVTREYFEAEDIFDSWVTECCSVAADKWDNPKPLYTSWSMWCEANGYSPGSMKKFSADLESHGYEKGTKNSVRGRHWIGLQIRES